MKCRLNTVQSNVEIFFAKQCYLTRFTIHFQRTPSWELNDSGESVNFMGKYVARNTHVSS